MSRGPVLVTVCSSPAYLGCSREGKEKELDSAKTVVMLGECSEVRGREQAV